MCCRAGIFKKVYQCSKSEKTFHGKFAKVPDQGFGARAPVGLSLLLAVRPLQDAVFRRKHYSILPLLCDV